MKDIFSGRDGEQALAGLRCPACGADRLQAPQNGYSTCRCGFCGASVALHAVLDPQEPGGIAVTVVGVREFGYRATG